MVWAISPNHIEILKALNVQRVIVLFDGDEAGRKGTLSTVEALVPHFEVRVPTTPNGFKPHGAAPEVLDELLGH